MEDQNSSPRREKLSIDNSFKVVQLALEFARNGKELIRLAEKNNYAKITKLGKKLVPVAIISKLMKPGSHNALDRKRQDSLQEFVYITDKLKQRTNSAAKTSAESDSRLAEDIKQCLQEGHMILAAVILHETQVIISLYSSNESSVSKPNLVRLLMDVKSYCELVNTMKFPVEWENLISEDRTTKKTVTVSNGHNSLDQSKKDTNLVQTKGKNNNVKVDGISEEHETKRIKSDSDSDDTDSEEEETHTVQIEIRGNTGGFVGSTIEFDLVVTYEDGSPVKVQSSDFAVEITGPAAASPVTITAKSDSSFRIEFIPTEPGANTLSIYMHNTLLTSGIKSIISKAGETAYLVHSKDISRGQLQGISVVPINTHDMKSLSKSDLLKQKLQDISTALELLQNIRLRTRAELEELSNNNSNNETTNT